MAASRAAKADRRAVKEHGPRIRDALAGGDAHKALNLALRYLQGEAAHGRRHCPADQALTDAELAARITFIAASLPRRKPRRPPGCPGVPRPADLLAIFAAAMRDAASEEGEQE